MKKFETIQEAADYAVLKMVEQGGTCINENGHCAYEGFVNGAKSHCAIGHLICDGRNLHIEGEINDAVEYFSGSVNYELITNNLMFFDCLQCFHDVETETKRRDLLGQLSNYIDTSKPQYKQWVEMV